MWYLIGLIALFCVSFYFFFGHAAVMMFWRCLRLDVKISYIELAKLKRQNVNIDELLRYAIKLKEQGGYDVRIKDLKSHKDSGGDLTNVTSILINARKKKIDISYTQAAMMDLEEINKKKKAS